MPYELKSARFLAGDVLERVLRAGMLRGAEASFRLTGEKRIPGCNLNDYCCRTVVQDQQDRG